ncbi:hypothetical protein [Holospora undulata]|uniref:Uncharacterized protein n=1 Tax=Holospora undulata HU1 TaxID=1321371 RepID=A0A061JGF6_9PROT|nr:hypothetical protein [Holospora undulata]ETZ05080.1 hypothetical protein K737_300494 [Holospora undulata HU1]
MIKLNNNLFFIFFITLLFSHQGYAPPKHGNNSKNEPAGYQLIQRVQTYQDAVHYLNIAFNNYPTQRELIPVIYSKILSFLFPYFKEIIVDLGRSEKESLQSLLSSIREKLFNLAKSIFFPFILLKRDKLKDDQLRKDLQPVYFQDFFPK